VDARSRAGGARARELPGYPRIPYLWRADASEDDEVVPPDAIRAWLGEPVVVEEKLDGANVSLWLDDGRILVASRGGVGAMDRAGQLGRLRAWVGERGEPLREVLADGWVLYGEWLWLRHGVPYDGLPDWLVVLDLWRADGGFAATERRDEIAVGAGLALPPRLFGGVLGSRETLVGLLGTSGFSTEPMEGAVLRRDGERAKVLQPGFRRRNDEEWSSNREHNELHPARHRRALRST
jgi:hypothetical protein